jgi:hypothetical protein
MNELGALSTLYEFSALPPEYYYVRDIPEDHDNHDKDVDYRLSVHTFHAVTGFAVHPLVIDKFLVFCRAFQTAQ